eukprot:56442_1
MFVLEVFDYDKFELLSDELLKFNVSECVEYLYLFTILYIAFGISLLSVSKCLHNLHVALIAHCRVDRSSPCFSMTCHNLAITSVGDKYSISLSSSSSSS